MLSKLSINLTNLKIAGGAKIDCLDKDGFTPLHRCCQEKPISKDEEILGEKSEFKNRFLYFYLTMEVSYVVNIQPIMV
jgi:hypothetical protein